MKKIFLIITLIYHCFSAQSQALNSLIAFKFYTSEQDVKEKYGSFSFKERYLQDFQFAGKFEDVPAMQTEMTKSVYLYKDGKGDSTLAAYIYQRSPSGMSEQQSARAINRKINRTLLQLFFPPNTRIYGGGEQFSYFELNKGRYFRMWSEENGIGRGDKPITNLTKKMGISGEYYATYFPIPFFLTSTFQYFYIEDCNNCEIRIKETPKATVVEIMNHAPYITWTTHQSKDYKTALQDFHQENKFRYQQTDKKDSLSNQPLPEWAYGTVLGLQGGREKVSKIVADCQKEGMKISAIWIQDWVGKKKVKYGSRLNWTWKPDATAYPDLEGFIQEMNQKGIKVLGYINPFLAVESEYAKEAKLKNFLVKNAKKEDYLIDAGGFDAYMIDLSNPNAFDWYIGVIQTELIGRGFSGWMADFGEWLPTDAKTYARVSGEEYHNLYPLDWALCNRMAINDAGKQKEIMFFMRSGGGGSSLVVPMFWSGDQMTGWGKNDGISSAVMALNSAAMSGIPFLHSDIGGYTSIKYPFFRQIRDRDLLYRWAEMAVFTPFFRTHEGLNPTKDFQFYQDTAAIHFMAKMGDLHLSLQKYIKYYADDALKTGLPVCRPLMMEFPNDSLTFDLSTQFMLGEDIIVAPVLQPKTFEVKAYLPQGKWQHIITKKVYEGGKTHKIAVKYGQPAAFARVGGRYVFE